MLKFLIIPIVGLLLSAGTYFYEDAVSSPCSTLPSTVSTNCEQDSRERGFPLSYAKDVGQVADVAADNGLDGTFQTQDTQVNTTSLIQNYGFWLIAAGIGYFIFEKIRNVVGTVVLVGLGVAAGLVYFGILVL